MQNISLDFRVALRRLRSEPLLALFVVLTLAVGIAANTIIFSIADSVLFRSLPFPDGDRLVWISHGVPGFPQGGATFSYPVYRDILEQNTSFDQIGAYLGWGQLVLTGKTDPIRVKADYVTPSYLSLLGARAQLGRLLRPQEDRFGSGDAVAVLSNTFWQRQFGSDPAAVGQTIHLNGYPFTVVGVAARDFRDAPNEQEQKELTDVWIPLGVENQITGLSSTTNRTSGSIWAVAHMKPGVTLAQARADLAAITQRLATTYPQTDIGYTIVPRTLRSYLIAPLFVPARILLVASFCLLLIGCANVANLLFARLLGRRRELAVRSALGASTRRLVSYLLIENAVLTALAGCVALALSSWAIGVLRAWAPTHLPSVVRVHAGVWVFLASIGISLATGLLFGVAPALFATRVNIQETLSQGGRQGEGLGRRHGQKILVVAEVSLALVVLVAAGMLVQSFRRLAATPLGFDSANLLTLRLNLLSARYSDPRIRVQFNRVLQEKLDVLPGVKSATLWGPSMLGRARYIYIGYPEGSSPTDPNARLLMDRHSVNPGGLANLDISLLRGRDVTWDDTATTPAVAIVSEGVANTLWPGQDPIGKRMRSAGAFQQPVTVIGIARDACLAERFDLSDATNGIAPAGIGPQYDAYFSAQQYSNPQITVALRIASDPGAVATELKGAVRSIDPQLPVFDLAMLDDRMAAQLAPFRLIATLSSAYAAVALFLAALGLFAVLSHDVSQRVHEIGVRMALGAQPGDVVRLILREGIALTAAGLLVGISLGVLVSNTMRQFLFGVSPSAPAIYAAIAAVLTAVALVACWFPARRATKFDPMRILRGE